MSFFIALFIWISLFITSASATDTTSSDTAAVVQIPNLQPDTRVFPDTESSSNTKSSNESVTPTVENSKNVDDFWNGIDDSLDQENPADHTDTLNKSLQTKPEEPSQGPIKEKRSTHGRRGTGETFSIRFLRVILIGCMPFFRSVEGYFSHFVFAIIVICMGIFAYFRFIKKGDKDSLVMVDRLLSMNPEAKRVCRFIEKNIRNPELTIDTICRELMTSTTFLELLFEKELGMSVAVFIEQTRINHVIRYLRKDRSCKPEDIARLAGFKTLHELDQAFFRVTGKTRQEYLKIQK